MKRALSLVLLVILVLSISTACFATSSGSATIPCWVSTYYSGQYDVQTKLFISNITNDTITVTISLYQKNGDLLHDDGSASTGYVTGQSTPASYNDDNTVSGTVTFDLAGGDTCSIVVSNLTGQFGYGSINWSETGTQPAALMAYGLVYNANYNTYSSGEWFVTRHDLTINEGKAF